MRKSVSKYIKELSQFLGSAQNIAMVCHHNPDGDAIGSMLAMYHYLTAKGKRCYMISPNALQKFLRWMKGSEEIIVFEDEPGKSTGIIKKADLVIMLDFNHSSRIGKIEDTMNTTRNVRILIDHHPGPEIEADLVISEPSISSTAELLFELINGLEGSAYLENDFIESIFVGMMTDTGNFNFGPFDGDTLRIVALMLDAGLDKDYITDRIYDNFSASRMRLKGFTLSERMVVLPQYKTAYIYLYEADLDRFKYEAGDTEGFVNMPLSIDGIIFSVLFIERKNHIKLSLRSKGNLKVNSFAGKYFEGGGHINAAGGRSNLELIDCIKYFESLLTELPEYM
ncbi:MAG: DHH family phosphoesterase [Bacteroidales bacterium]|nr:DHH family phosphoesterase [Bacteroidales bacterium]